MTHASTAQPRTEAPVAPFPWAAAAGRGRMPAALPLATLDALHDGLAVHDGEGRQVHANAALRDLAEAQDGFAWHQRGGVLPSTPMALRLLDRALAAAASGTPIEMPVPRPSGAAPYLLRCAPLPGHAGWTVLRVTDPGTRRHPPTATFLRAAFQLTAAEAALATSLCAGTSIIEHARARGISVHTARTQLRALLLKTGAERQVDLIGLLTALAR